MSKLKDRNIKGMLLKREGHRGTLSMARWSRKFVTFSLVEISGQDSSNTACTGLLRYYAATSASKVEGLKPRKELRMNQCTLHIDVENLQFEIRAPRGYKIMFKCASAEELEDWVSRIEPSDNYRERLIAFYKEKRPQKLDQVDLYLERYKGKEEELMKVLVKKYGDTDVEKRASLRRASFEKQAVEEAEDVRKAAEEARKAKELEEAPYFEEVRIESFAERKPSLGSGRVVMLEDAAKSSTDGGEDLHLKFSKSTPTVTDEEKKMSENTREVLASCKPVVIVSILGSRDLPPTKENALHVELHMSRTAYLPTSRPVWRTPAQKNRVAAFTALGKQKDLNPIWDAHAVLPGHAQQWRNQTLVLKLVSRKAIVAECSVKFASTVRTIPARYHVLLPTASALRRAANTKSSTFSFKENDIQQPSEMYDSPNGQLFKESPTNAHGSPGAENLGALLVAVSVVEPSVAMETSGHEKVMKNLIEQLERIQKENENISSSIELHPESLAEANRSGLKNTEYFEGQFTNFRRRIKAAASEQNALRKQIRTLETRLQEAEEKNREQAKTISLLNSSGSVPPSYENVQKSGYYLVPMNHSASDKGSRSPIEDVVEERNESPPVQQIRSTTEVPTTSISLVAEVEISKQLATKPSPPASPPPPPPPSPPPLPLAASSSFTTPSQILANTTPPLTASTEGIVSNAVDTSEKEVVHTMPPLSTLESRTPRHASETKSQSARKNDEQKRRVKREARITTSVEKQSRQDQRTLLPYEIEEKVRQVSAMSKRDREMEERQTEVATKLERERSQRVEAVKRRMAKKKEGLQREEAQRSVHEQHLQRLKTGLRQIKQEDPTRWA